MGIFYATREQILRSLEILQSSYAGSLIDAKIDSSSRSIEGQLHRRFYPERRTILKDWPNPNPAYAWEVDLGDQEVISVSSVLSGGRDITSGIQLRRGDDLVEPPYGIIQVDLSVNGVSFSAGTTFQRSLTIAGLFGHNDTDTSLAGGSLSAGINSSVNILVANPSSGMFTLGIGSILLIGTERLIVANRLLTTSGQTISADVAATQATKTISSAGAANFAIGETILIDGERMLIDDIAGTTLIVRRAWDGTALATHTTGATIFAARQFTVVRGALGSTAAAHSSADPIYVHNFPALINELCVAETVCALEQNAGAYARTIGTGSSAREAVGGGLEDVRARAYAAYGRKSRVWAI